MAKPPSKRVKQKEAEEIETDPGAWERFEHAVDAAVKGGPKNRTPPKPKKARPKHNKRKKI